MTLTSRSAADLARPLALVAGLALVLALLPVAGTAQAQDPPPNAPCPEGTPEADFADRDSARSTHVRSIDCVAYHAISVGSSDTEGNPVYLPAGIVNRAQMATFIAKTIEAGGEELPDGGGEDEFTDISGTVHRERINALARAGIVSGRTAELYRPNLPVTRAQMATFILQAAEYVFDEELEAEDGPWFEDAIGTTHEANIDAGFEFGLFEGRVAPTEDTLGIFDTRSGTRRDQMATFLSRLLDFIWIEQGIFGAVIDADDDEPIADADVTITDEDGDDVVELTTGDSGLFLAELDAGTYDVTADAEGYEALTLEDVEVDEGEITEVTLALAAEVELAQGVGGTVGDQDGESLGGVTVTALDNGTEVESDTTDEDGEYFLDLAVGTYTVTAELEGYGTETETNVEVEADQVTDQDFTLTLVTGTITVTVEDEDENPFAGATVTVTDEADDAVAEETTGGTGVVTFTLVPGTYEVTATATDFDDDSATVTLEADDEETVTLTLEPTFTEPLTATLTADREIAPASDEANPGNDFPTRGDINFFLEVEDAEGATVPTIGRDYVFEVENTGDTEVVIACVRCADPQNVTIDPQASHTFDEPDRERVRIDAAGEASVEVTASTTVAGETVTADPVTAEWVDVDEEPTGGGAAADFAGTVAAFNTGEDHEWYLIDAGEEDGYVYVEYTGGTDDTYLIEGGGVDLEAFEAALALGLDIDYETDDQDEQTHHLTPVGNGDNDNGNNG